MALMLWERCPAVPKLWQVLNTFLAASAKPSTVRVAMGKLTPCQPDPAQGWSNTGRGCPEELRSLHPWTYSKLHWTHPQAT